jgi:hypothetical protein
MAKDDVKKVVAMEEDARNMEKDDARRVVVDMREDEVRRAAAMEVDARREVVDMEEDEKSTEVNARRAGATEEDERSTEANVRKAAAMEVAAAGTADQELQTTVATTRPPLVEVVMMAPTTTTRTSASTSLVDREVSTAAEAEAASTRPAHPTAAVVATAALQTTSPGQNTTRNPRPATPATRACSAARSVC